MQASLDRCFNRLAGGREKRKVQSGMPIASIRTGSWNEISLQWKLEFAVLEFCAFAEILCLQPCGLKILFPENPFLPCSYHQRLFSDYDLIIRCSKKMCALSHHHPLLSDDFDPVGTEPMPGRAGKPEYPPKARIFLPKDGECH